MKDFLRHIYYLLCRYVFILLPDKHFHILTTYLTFKRFNAPFYDMNLEQPLSFNEKLNYLKMHHQNPLGTLVADKVAVREYVKEKIGEQYLIPVLGVYNTAAEIPFEQLPEKFVLKTNHGSGWNVVCTNKQTLDIALTRKKFNRWLGYNAFYLSREYQYKNIPPAILCESFLRFNIEDYKFFCFNGEPAFVQIDIGRFTNHERAYYDTNWQKLDFSICYAIAKEEVPKPAQLNEMLEVVRKLSKDFLFARVDLYLHDDRIFFGEITMFPEGGHGPFLNNADDYKVGELLQLPSL
ncbi:MAG: hypothetical protein LCH58_11685 [Bacteroidetes bacterium]|uniref:ATP-grasp fold amidoligase family protein n=1 Tax=Phnomibacter sp. TaxID=2836217 RepID=UPI002FDE293A|nr:hypothetical protein [Bacteroidota bacterium]